MATKKVTKKTNDLSTIEIPKWLQVGKDDLGTDGIESGDIQMPRIKLCNPASMIDKAGIGVSDGELFDVVTGKVFGKSLIMFPLLTWKSKVWFSDSFTLLCTQYLNKETGQTTEFGSDTSVINDKDKEGRSKGKDSYNFMVITEEELQKAIAENSMPFPTAFSTVGTANKPTKQLNGKLKMNAMRSIPIYGQAVEITTKLVPNKKGTDFYIPQYAYPRFANEKEFAMLKVLHEKAKTLQSRAVSLTGEDSSVL